MPSIRRYLIQAILLILLVTSIISVASSYILFRNEMRRVYDTQLATVSGVVSGIIDHATTDHQLEGIAYQLSAQTFDTRYYPVKQSTPTSWDDIKRTKPFPSSNSPIPGFAIAVWSDDGQPRILSHVWSEEGHPPLASPKQSGFKWIQYDHEDWRVYTHYDHDSHCWISVGLRHNVLTRLSHHMVWTSWSSDALGVILAAVLIFSVIHRAVKPINMLSRQLKQRDEQDLSPVDGDVPIELEGFKAALNDFMNRLNHAIEQERRFTADAAHELQTPLAALKIHLDNIRHSSPDKAELSLEKARLGIDRLRRVIIQLLTLAHIDRNSIAEQSDINLYQVAAQLAGEMLPIAEKRQQELSISGLSRLIISANTTEIGVLLKNLIDNALRYTPDGGHVEIHLSREPDGTPCLSVLDDGPGIAPELIEHVTDRFRRGNDPDQPSGSGLGLSIVSGLLQHQRARLSLSNRESGGLIAKITWPYQSKH